MSRTYKFLDQTQVYFVSFATVHWIYSSVLNYYGKPGLVEVELCY